MPGSHSSNDYGHGSNESPTQSLGSKPTDGGLSSSEDTTTSEDGGNFRESLQIDMKGLVGDAVGNMSISPASRDVVLAARRGLFIIDLKSPFEVPRFLPQGGTWDVADVQWNPHHRRAEYIVSTSSEKLLIWNLFMSGKTSIEHILHSHYRAITDINWHTTECDTVASTGIDSWVWAWDLRETRKPVFGLSAFNSPGTQVKWNKRDANILASSHANDVLIWDRRKGSVPITIIRGHTSRIYGIDWSHGLRNEIVTCSLDKTIKVWDIENYVPESRSARSGMPSANHLAPEPKHEIHTTYPVWRARNTPFGKGVLSLPQRSDTTLELYSTGMDTNGEPVRTFEGHNDVVKEFVWRKGGQHDNEFQLITWSKDRTLRFWPVYHDTLQKVGYDPSQNSKSTLPRNFPVEQSNSTISFRNPPSQSESVPLLSAPIGNRAILAEVRAGAPPRQRNTLYGGSDVHETISSQFAPGSAPGISSSADTLHPSMTLRVNFRRTISSSFNPSGGGTMSRGAAGNKSRANVDPLSWLTSVKVGDRRGSSSGPGSQTGSNDGSGVGSGSRELGGQDISNTVLPVIGSKRQRSDSQSRPVVEEKDSGQSLQDEITSVLTKLSSSKIKLEKHDLTKKRTCTLGLQVPWGASSSVFMRITFTFPRDYPQGIHPEGTPTIELDRTPLISIRDRAFILRHLRAIRERQRPCLEACLRFLLFRIEDEQQEAPLPLESESSSDEEGGGRPRPKRMTSTLIRNSKNLAEPRTSQGTFGPNGELVCFFAAPPRIIRSVPHGLSKSPSRSSDNAEEKTEEPPSRMFQSPALVNDAVRRLSLAASDRVLKVEGRRSESGEHLTRIMTSLLTFSRHRRPSFQEPVYSGDGTDSFMMPSRRSTVVISNTSPIAGCDKIVAADYIFLAPDMLDLCDQNASFARAHGRYDHERIFHTLGALLGTWIQVNPSQVKGADSLIKQTVSRLLLDLRVQKDVQMLAMISAILLQSFPAIAKDRGQAPKLLNSSSNNILLAKFGGSDYFSIPRRRTMSNRISPNSPTWTPQPPSESLSYASTLAPGSSGSRGSWSNLFNPGNMRVLMTGMQETMKDNVPPEAVSSTPGPWISVPLRKRAIHEPDSPFPRQRAPRRDSLNTLYSPVSKSWTESMPFARGSLSFSSDEHRLPPIPSKGRTADERKRAIVFDEQSPEPSQENLFGREETTGLLTHVHVYAEILFRWQLFHKRLELLKSVKRPTLHDQGLHSIGVVRICPRCATQLPTRGGSCPSCSSICSVPLCSICRLSVKGLAINCVRCLHIAHMSCWKKLRISICPAGCGCRCA